MKKIKNIALLVIVMLFVVSCENIIQDNSDSIEKNVDSFYEDNEQVNDDIKKESIVKYVEDDDVNKIISRYNTKRPDDIITKENVKCKKTAGGYNSVINLPYARFNYYYSDGAPGYGFVLTDEMNIEEGKAEIIAIFEVIFKNYTDVEEKMNDIFSMEIGSRYESFGYVFYRDGDYNYHAHEKF